MMYNSITDYYIDNRNGLIEELVLRGTKYCDILTAISGFDFAVCDAIKNAVIINSQTNSSSFLDVMKETKDAIGEYNLAIQQARRVGYSSEPDFNYEALLSFSKWVSEGNSVENDNVTNFYNRKSNNDQSQTKSIIIDLFPDDLERNK